MNDSNSPRPRPNAFGQPLGPATDFQGALALDVAVLSGGHCELQRTVPERHAAALHDAFLQDTSDAQWTYLPYGPFDTREAFDAWLVTATAASDPYFFTVVDSADESIGLLALMRIAPEAGSVEIGHVHFSQSLQRTAAATEAVFLLLELAFERGFRRVEWKCDALNAPSRACALRLGFSFEGVFRQHLVYKGRNRDTAWFSLLDSEWPAARAALLRWLDPNNFDSFGQQRRALATLR